MIDGILLHTLGLQNGLGKQLKVHPRKAFDQPRQLIVKRFLIHPQ